MAAKVLIVEDEMLVAYNLEAILSDLGFKTVGIAADAATALAYAEQRPDIAFVDLNLRDGPTGEIVARRLIDEYGVSIIYVTANPRQISDASAAIAVLPKPYDEDQITIGVRDALNRKASGGA